MKSFWKENWPYILTPIALVLVALVVIIMMSGGGGDDAPFIYNIF